MEEPSEVMPGIWMDSVNIWRRKEEQACVAGQKWGD